MNSESDESPADPEKKSVLVIACNAVLAGIVTGPLMAGYEYLNSRPPFESRTIEGGLGGGITTFFLDYWWSRYGMARYGKKQ